MTDSMDKPRSKRLPAELLTPAEARAIIAACSTTSATGKRNAALFTLLYRTGLRISEALALMPHDVDLDAGTATVLHGKGDHRRVAGFDQGARPVLDRWLAHRAQLPRVIAASPLFCTLHGTRLSAGYARAALQRTARRAGVQKRVHPHGLRHTHAAELAAEGVPAHEIQGQLGHANLATTDTYLRRIAPVDRLTRIHQRNWDAA